MSELIKISDYVSKEEYEKNMIKSLNNLDKILRDLGMSHRELNKMDDFELLDVASVKIRVLYELVLASGLSEALLRSIISHPVLIKGD